jgi:hypothetical protein
MLIVCSITVQAQSTFSKTDYENFLQQNSSMTYDDASVEYPLPQTYYKNNSQVNLYKYSYFDSLEMKYSLTQGEKDLIQKNGFMVSERLSYSTFEEAFRDVFHKDMPVFLSTDAILFALHASYDNILKEMEVSVMEPNIKKVLDSLYFNLPKLQVKYQSHPELKTSLADVDLYITVARSLIYNQHLAPQDTTQGSVDSLLKNVSDEQLILNMSLFGSVRNSDFSQFIPRGHYLDIINLNGKTLENYFKTMMWLGRIDFWLTSPIPLNTVEDSLEIKRMTYDALLLNELLQMSNSKNNMDENDKIISFLVGKSDNLTPNQLAQFKTNENVIDILALEDFSNFKKWYNKLDTCVAFEQQIMSDVSVSGDTSPVSYRLMGQRFIIDSYAFSKLTYDRVVYPSKPFRMMPKSLDISFVFGNNNALPLLENEIKNFGIAPNYVALRKTVDGYDSTFWAQTLYNTWFQAIRDLNPKSDTTGLPFFMTTAGWQHEKMTTQLASWAQLRHDNLLYAKQSYTSVPICSYPNSFVEPYPKMYEHIKQFAQNADSFFKPYNYLSSYFKTVAALMDTLESISKKELQHQSLNSAENLFLKKMIKTNIQHGCVNIEVVSGWYLDLIYGKGNIIQETVIADVHTQPANENGAIVGKILHVATGKVNMGVFMANAPLPDGRMMAFVGPVMSFYEKITDNFKRLTDQEWRDSVAIDKIPQRPDWTSIYLANKSGTVSSAGPELPSQFKTWNDSIISNSPIIKTADVISIYPNPLNNSTNLCTQFATETTVNIEICDLSGRLVYVLKKLKIQDGNQQVQLPLSQLTKGIYFCTIMYDSSKKVVKLIKQ